jgi:glycine/D-amino acid oxidase-like deaminating enzyme
MSGTDVVVIGGGIFGASAAVELASRGMSVLLLEQGPDWLKGATFANHNRHHMGYHYPRSLETARQCGESRGDFESVYGAAVVRDFSNFYAIAKEGSKTTPEAKVALCGRVEEAVYEFESLQRLVKERIHGTPRLTSRLNARVTGASVETDGSKTLFLDGGERIRARFVVNATYAYLNRFCGWLGFPGREFQFNLQELSVIALPGSPRVGITVQDGSYPSFIPLGRTSYYSWPTWMPPSSCGTPPAPSCRFFPESST